MRIICDIIQKRRDKYKAFKGRRLIGGDRPTPLRACNCISIHEAKSHLSSDDDENKCEYNKQQDFKGKKQNMLIGVFLFFLSSRALR